MIRNNAISFAGAAVVLYFMGLLDAYSRLVFFYFLLIDCILMLIVHQLWKKCLPSLYRIFQGEQEDAVGCGRCVRSAARHGYEKF